MSTAADRNQHNDKIFAQVLREIHGEQTSVTEQRLNAARLQPRFERCSFDNYDPQNAEQAKIRDFLRDLAIRLANPESFELSRKVSVVLLGPVGTGKTHLVHALANLVIADTPPTERNSECESLVLYRRVSDILRRIKASWNKPNFSEIMRSLDGYEDQETGLKEQELIERYCLTRILILDEVGVQFGSDTERNYLTEIIDRRYCEVLPTILVSNLDVKGVESCLGVRAMDRLYEPPSRVLLLNGKSYRTLSKK